MMNTMIRMSACQSVTYCYGGLEGVTHRDLNAFSSLLGATRAAASTLTNALLGASAETAQETKTGLTDEDMAYLRERYSGELNAVEVVRAVRMIYSMGGMTRMEYCAVWGARMTLGDAEGVPAFPELFSEAELSRTFSDAPISGFRSLDDIFAWLEELRGSDPEWELLRMGLANG